MSEAIIAYVKLVKERAEHVKGNEQATKQSLIGPLFTILGYDLTDPRECIPEHKEDFGREAKSLRPIDWAFAQGGRKIFLVEAKEVGKRIANYDEQLGDYFAKVDDAKLGILTNGIQWRFFTDLVRENIMDKEPFLKWDVFADEAPPFDFLTLLHKSQFNSQLIRTFAKDKRNQNLLVGKLNGLLEPSPEFIRLAVSNLESRPLTASIIQLWKPVVANALEEWVKQRMLSMVLSSPSPNDANPGAGSSTPSKIVTTKEELDGFAIVQRLLGPDQPVAYEDTTAYFKIHLAEKRTWVICRLYFEGRRPNVWVPLSLEQTQQLAPAFSASVPSLGWSRVLLNQYSDLESLGDLLQAAWHRVRSLKLSSSDEATPQSDSPAEPSPDFGNAIIQGETGQEGQGS